MHLSRKIIFWFVVLLCCFSGACMEHAPEYGFENPTRLPFPRRQTWAVAPMVNISGQRAADSILQADIVFQQLQQVDGVVAIPVNRTIEVMLGLRLDRIATEQQAQLICELLGCDGLVIPTISIYDPYAPPKLGAALQLFTRSPVSLTKQANFNPRDYARQASAKGSAPPVNGSMLQVVGMFDAQNGSVRLALAQYTKGRNDPSGPMGEREYLMVMDRYCGFAWHLLIVDLINLPKLRQINATVTEVTK